MTMALLIHEFANTPHTNYFVRDVLVKRPYIRLAWCMQALNQPLRREVQTDGRIRQWIFIDEVQRYLRVVTLEDGFTLHNAFFDRGFKP